ncbi:MAG: CvpA family protein [Gammaproteobacteria bacterium]|nr:CvpA family protein [Gammaproteobacteria bacterium]NIR96951.1 CvpA family protein [Gammaproteobacteria bacterium]NIT62653.1 CvpA family protein [Gammaproteobacteria bacterium]NIV19613.1 CvpA family protein [Gammaproteobacteria bacterium]NIX10833.1 CvpA family protein [Gammaproteobacteria bacterium]
MNWADVVIFAVIALSAVVSLTRGFVKESLSLAAWILAFWVAINFAYRLGGLAWISQQIESPTIRITLAFAVLFLLTLLAGSLANILVGRLVRRSGLSGTDRTLGVVFGLARGILLASVLVLLAGLTQLPREDWWNESLLLGQFQEIALWMTGFLPPDVQQSFEY